MASPEAITLKRANAVLAINKASTALAEKFGVELPEMPNVSQQDADFAHAAQLEHFGNVFTALAVGAKVAKPFKAEMTEPVLAPPPPQKVEEVAAAVEEDTPKAKRSPKAAKPKSKK